MSRHMRGSVAGSLCAGLDWGGVARADAPRVAKVTLADGQLDAATLPALSPGGRVAVPDIVPDGGRGYPNLKVELLDGGKGAPEVVAILSVEEVDSIGLCEPADDPKTTRRPPSGAAWAARNRPSPMVASHPKSTCSRIVASGESNSPPCGKPGHAAWTTP